MPPSLQSVRSMKKKLQKPLDSVRQSTIHRIAEVPALRLTPQFRYCITSGKETNITCGLYSRCPSAIELLARLISATKAPAMSAIDLLPPYSLCERQARSAAAAALLHIALESGEALEKEHAEGSVTNDSGEESEGANGLQISSHHHSAGADHRRRK